MDQIRIATHDDVDGIVALIDGVLKEYGDRICLTEGGSEADILDIQTGYRSRGGEFWVLESTADDGRTSIAGTHAARQSKLDESVCVFKRLYLHQRLRGSQWGHELMQVTLDWARANSFRRVEFWSDTRFERAHRFFEKFGFARTGNVRHMTDSAVPYSEYFFFLDL